MQLVGVSALVAAWLAAVLAENLGREGDANARSEPAHAPLPDNWISIHASLHPFPADYAQLPQLEHIIITCPDCDLNTTSTKYTFPLVLKPRETLDLGRGSHPWVIRMCLYISISLVISLHTATNLYLPQLEHTASLP